MPTNSEISYNYFISEGWKPYQAAAITGNLLGESNLQTGKYGDGGLAVGIAQWHVDRQHRFEQMFHKKVKDATLNDQLAFVNWELNNTEIRAGNRLRATTNLNDATSVVMTSYERPKDSSSFGNRLRYAAKVLGGKAIDNIENTSNDVKNVGGGILNGLGITGDCNYLCQFETWIANSHFWQRIAIAILALILIAGGIYLLPLSQNSSRLATA